MAGNYGLSWKQHPSSSLLKACFVPEGRQEQLAPDVPSSSW